MSRYGTTTTFVPTSAKSHIASPSARDIRTPPVFSDGSGLSIEPSSAALNPTATPSTIANRTTCSIITPSEPLVAAPERGVTTSYVPGRGFSELGMTAKLLVTSPAASTSHTWRSARAYTTRVPVPEAVGSAAGGFFSFGLSWPAAGALLETFGLGAATESGAFADAW